MQRMAAARERMLGRYPDRDAEEARRMESFRGLSKEELKRKFEEAAAERGIKLQEEQNKQLVEHEH
jgi:hypothetical protein